MCKQVADGTCHMIRCEVDFRQLFPAGGVRSVEWIQHDYLPRRRIVETYPLPLSASEGDGLNGHLSRCWSRPQIRATTSWFYIVSGRVEDTSGPVLSSFVQNWSLSMRMLPYLRLEAWSLVHSLTHPLSLFLIALAAASFHFFCRKENRFIYLY